MSIITISRGTFSGGKSFAENLAKKLGYPCLGREELSEEAIKLGVPVGKLQTAMLKPPRYSHWLTVEREYYLSCVTMILCQYALEGNLVYHGHTGHLLLPGIPNIFRIRVLADTGYRIREVMRELNLTQEKAENYIKAVDADRDRWVRFLYGVNWHDPMHYDIVVNLANMGVENSTTALCSMAELPNFILTPSAEKALRNLRLASEARFMLARDKRTCQANVKVTADNGIVQVTYMPQDAEVAPYVTEVLAQLQGCRDIRATIAKNNILWLSETFDPQSEVFRNLVQIARKWDAAVEIMQLASEMNETQGSQPVKIAPTIVAGKGDDNFAGGFEEEIEEKESADRAGINATLDALHREECSGGSSTIYGDKETLITTLGHRTHYSLVVIGDVFASKAESLRKRLSSELRSLLADSIKAPVIGADELREELKFGFIDAIKMAMLLLIVLLIFTGIFTNQSAILDFLASEEYRSFRIIAVLFIVLLVPCFAYSYGTLTRQILRLFRLD